MKEPQEITVDAIETARAELAVGNAKASLEALLAQRDKTWVFADPVYRIDLKCEVVLARNVETGEIRAFIDGTYVAGPYNSWILDMAATLPWKGGPGVPGYERPSEPMVVTYARGPGLS